MKKWIHINLQQQINKLKKRRKVNVQIVLNLKSIRDQSNNSDNDDGGWLKVIRKYIQVRMISGLK